jgi:pimeloyl-ACP methyl ester carboxylesterase
MVLQSFINRSRWLANGIVIAIVLSLGAFSLGWGENLAQAQEEKEAKEPIKPAPIELITKDEVRLQATYYPSSEGKDAIPVIILHDAKTDRNAYHALAMALQADGMAVIVPDMRGFGESTKIRQFGGQPDIEFDAKKMGTVGFGRMVTTDMEKIKSFLKDENDAGKLNLNQLCVIAVGDLGCAIAINWTYGDWNFQDLNTIKQSKDVHALILVSPESNFKNLQIPKILTPLAKIQGPNQSSAERLSFFFIVGAGMPGAAVKPKEWRTVKSFADTVARFHPQPPKNQIKADQTLFFGEMPTSLQAGDLLSPNMLRTPIQIEGFQPVPLQAMILTFIDWRIREKSKEFPWSSRKIPGS